MARDERVALITDLRGLDLVTPFDQMRDGRTPKSKNFRLYAQQEDDRRVAVSSRKGPAPYVSPLDETTHNTSVSTTGADTAKVGVEEDWHAQPFKAPRGGRLTGIELKVHDEDYGFGPLMVDIYTEKDDQPYNLLGTSSISSGDIGQSGAYKLARFINAPQLNEDETYYIVLYIQDDGGNQYTLSTTTSGTYGGTTNTSVSSLHPVEYSINFKLRMSDHTVDKGAIRWNREGADNRTLVVYGDKLYQVKQNDGTLTEVYDELDPQAVEYSWAVGDNKIFWVNGYDHLTTWDGILEDDHDELITNGSADSNTSGWSGYNSSSIALDTSVYSSSPASIKVSKSSGGRGADYARATEKGLRYKMTFKLRMEEGEGDITYELNDENNKETVGYFHANDEGWTEHTVYYAPEQAREFMRFYHASRNFYIDDLSMKETGIEYIRDSRLEILSQITFHKERIFGVVAGSRNKIVFSEIPGKPAFDAEGKNEKEPTEQWYYEWPSVNFWYIPRPYSGSPIVGIISFQDSLTVFTQDNKYILSGEDRGNMSVRQSTGVKGALSMRGITNDANFIYFVADDGLYQFDGSYDTKLSKYILPLFDECPRKHEITPVIWKNQVRFYMATQGSTVNDACVIFDNNTEEILFDTETYVNRALYYGDADDNQELVELSSVAPTLYYGDSQYNALGAPIDFEYRFNYDSMGSPAQRKRIKRFYPLLQGVDSSFRIGLNMDKDHEDSPRIREQMLSVKGSVWGAFDWGDGTTYGYNTRFKPRRQSYPGNAYYWQLRVSRRGVDNRVALMGAEFSYRTKRL